jgi:hypothetical protein
LLGLARLLTGYSILISSETFDTFKIPALRIFLFVLSGLATAAFVCVALISRFLDPKREYEITDLIHHGPPEPSSCERDPSASRSRTPPASSSPSACSTTGSR